jgi:very-short-patch-repair endonuclease
MNVIVFGPQPPQVSFKQDPSGAVGFEFENDTVVYLDAEDAGILGKPPNDLDVQWADVYLSLLHNRGLVDLEMYHEEEWPLSFERFVEEDLQPLLSTDSERRFFELYVELCRESYDPPNDVWEAPALIPQVWVNWIHYDPKSKERAERVQREAFRVDFMLRSNDTGGFVAIEIDGSSHFGGRSFVDERGRVMFEASMEAYTKHLRKDRYLRKQGWQVVRISNSEIDEISSTTEFRELLADLLDLRTLDRIELKSLWS